MFLLWCLRVIELHYNTLVSSDNLWHYSEQLWKSQNTFHQDDLLNVNTIFFKLWDSPRASRIARIQLSNQQFRPPTNKRARFPIWTNQCARLKLNHITISLIGDWCLIVLMHQSHCFECQLKLYSKQAAAAAVTWLMAVLSELTVFYKKTG